jgi:hypothetical protein
MNHLSQTLGISKDADKLMETPWWGAGVKPPEMVAEAKLALERQNEVVIPSVVRTVTQSCSDAIDSLKETLTYDVWCVRRPPPFPFEKHSLLPLTLTRSRTLDLPAGETHRGG